MSKKKIITIVSITLATVLLIGGGFLLFNNIKETQKTENPLEISSPKTEEEKQKEYEKKITDFQTSEEYINTVNSYSQYLNNEESDPGYFYNGNLTIPSLYAVSKYIEEGYFNPYFVSNFWETKDERSFNSIDSFLGKYITDSYKEELRLSIPDNINNRFYIPDTNFSIPSGCAEKWTDYECFHLPSSIKKITYKGESSTTAIYTVEFQMNVNVQDSNQPLGAYTNQQRNYTVDFTVVNTEPKKEVPDFKDVKINNVSASLEITNTEPIADADASE